MSEIKTATENWIRAEYEFRVGPRAYCTETEDWYAKATIRLRRALTGFGELAEACRELRKNDKEK